METGNESGSGDLKMAPVSDRVVAFSVDAALAVAGYFLSHLAIFPHDDLLGSPHGREWGALWTFLFLLYQAYFSGEGRQSLGKWAMGIRIVDGDGQPLSLEKSCLRSATYLVSSILDLGFLWSLFNPGRQCWHDMVVGSFVIEEAAKPAPARFFVRAAAVGCLSLVAGLWYWNNVANVRYHRIMNVSYAKVGMSEISVLQKIYHIKNHRYADSLQALAPLSGEPVVFMRNMDDLFDSSSGVRFQATKNSYTVTANAMDDNRTLVALNGP